ncbi:MAG: alanine--tRNA ligase [Cytophagales bacterium]|nr:alanine--tRNA ligase [Cytophagales bacterium]
MDAGEIRAKFLSFFKEKDHQIVVSAPLVVKDDPTLMFTNAGMNQFKDFFLGNKRAKIKRIADTQKCLRVSGKHNDLEEVGIDTYHHTMFEMLGNWSFGDYFKKEAIAWAWELLTEVYGLPGDRLYATVFGGDKSEGLETDDEAYGFWKEILPEDKILYGSKKDNFWEMGDTGPCGPCSELHIDLRPDSEVAKKPGKELVNADHPQVIEIWNLVFIQFNRKANGALENLPEKHVDTGMGFERLVMAIQGKMSNYDTDVFTPLIDFIADMSGIKYGRHEDTDVAIRVIVDHIRAVAFTIADGQLPSNTGAGYVIRRILRRAVRYGFNYLNFTEPFMYKLLPVLAKQFDRVFPELREQLEFISKVIKEEETSFLRTLENGLKIFNETFDAARKESNGNTPIISGDVAFKLLDTYGFPIDLTQLLARERNADVNMEQFDARMAEQKNRSKSDAAQEKGDWIVLDDSAEVVFTGYETLVTDSRILRYRQIKEKKKNIYQIVLEKTPFYAESGGQVGDTGYIEAGGEKVFILDTQKENDLIIQYAEKLPSDIHAVYRCVVDEKKRRLTENNHSATHLLQAALREVLGDHVQQRGSLVNAKILRFDFSHFSKVTDEEMEQIEQIVNRRIRENIPLDEKRNIPIDRAKSIGAMALFGEKYGDFVRVITFDPEYSVELCGGTHVPMTGKIGLFKIISESSIAAGVRRIEAITADEAEAYVSSNLKVLHQIKALFNNPKDLLKIVEGTLDEKAELSRQIDKMQLEQAGNVKIGLIQGANKSNGITEIVDLVKLPNADTLKKIAFELKNEVDDLFMVLAAEIGDKPQIAIMISDALVSKYGLNAGAMVRELAKEIKGGGGGQPFFATAGGKDIRGLSNVISKAKSMIAEAIGV